MQYATNCRIIPYNLHHFHKKNYIFNAMSASLCRINNFIQRKIKVNDFREISLITASNWLDNAGLLKDSDSSPGYPLRRHIHKGNIFGAFRKNNYFWHIRAIDDYNEILCLKEVSKLLGLKSRTSIYRKLKLQNIPYIKHNSGNIYIRKTDFLNWAIQQNSAEIFERIQKSLLFEDLKTDLKNVKSSILKNTQ